MIEKSGKPEQCDHRWEAYQDVKYGIYRVCSKCHDRVQIKETQADTSIREMNQEDEGLINMSLQPKGEPEGSGWYDPAIETSDGAWKAYGTRQPSNKEEALQYIEKNQNNKLVLCEYMMNPHILHPVEEEEEGTPGPWRVDSSHDELGSIVGSENQKGIAVCQGPNHKENAKKIAKAWLIPELVKCLERYSDIGDEELNAVLAKAKDG